MRIIRVFPQKTSHTPTDSLVFIGDPPMFRPQCDEVHISCTFTWDIEKSRRLMCEWEQYYPVKIGGPAFNYSPNGFTPGLYVKSGITFTTRGCNNQCPWCLVPLREGRLYQYPDFCDGHIIQDNNILQSDDSHWYKVIQMLKTQSQIEFLGGLESRLLTNQRADDIRSLKIKQVFLACDTKFALKSLIKAVRLLQLPIRQIRCYVLIGFGNESISEARERLESVYHAGALPFAQLYQPSDKLIQYNYEWRSLARTFSRPAATFAEMRRRNE